MDHSLFPDFESVILSTFKIVHPYGISLAVLTGILLIIEVSSNSTSYPEMFIRILCLICLSVVSY